MFLLPPFGIKGAKRYPKKNPMEVQGMSDEARCRDIEILRILGAVYLFSSFWAQGYANVSEEKFQGSPREAQ